MKTIMFLFFFYDGFIQLKSGNLYSHTVLLPPPPTHLLWPSSGSGALPGARQGAVASAVRRHQHEVQGGGAEQPGSFRGEPGLLGPEGLQQLQQQPGRLP